MSRAQNVFESAFYPENPIFRKITTLEAHTAGEPLRIFIDGLPSIPSSTVSRKQEYISRKHDYIRKAILQEPRGHADQYGAILTVPDKPAFNADGVRSEDGADIDVIFLNTKGYSSMCGHGTLAITKVYLEMGFRGKQVADSTGRLVSYFNMDTPAGRVQAHGIPDSTGTVERTYFQNVPSFVYLLDAEVQVPDIGTIKFDLAFGGLFFAIVEVSSLPLDPLPTITSSCYSQLIELGRKIKAAITSNFFINHPYEPSMSFLFGVLLTGPALNPSHHSRNVNVYEDGIVDRSPCGTGLSARAAVHHARGQLTLGEKIEVESIIGSTMTVEVKQDIQYGGYEAVIPEVGGQAFVMGKAEWWIDPNDKIGDGFLLR